MFKVEYVPKEYWNCDALSSTFGPLNIGKGKRKHVVTMAV